jgi:hypothetical protein
MSISDIHKGGSGLPPRIVIYGRPAVGKTSMAAASENPVFLMSPGETGLHSLIDSGQLSADIPNVEVPDWPNLMGLIEELTTKEHQRKTLVLDVANGFEKLANEFTRNRDFPGENGDKEFVAYMAGYRTCAMGAWKELQVALDKLRRAKSMMIVLLAHTGITKVANPSAADYTKWAPNFDGHWAWDATFAWSDLTLFADYDMSVIKDKPKDPKGKAVSSGRRFLHTAWSPDYDAKTRYVMPDDIEMGSSGAEAWSNLMAALKPQKGGE